MNGTRTRITFVDTKATIETEPVPQPGNAELLVQSECSLISPGTESTALARLWDNAEFRASPGYALAGTVVEAGPECSVFKPGDRVLTLRPHASHVLTTENPWETLRIPEGVSAEAATFAVLGSVALHGVRRAAVAPGERMLVIGAGLVGLLTLQLCSIAGAERTIVSDPVASRCELAKQLGAAVTIRPDIQDLAAEVKAHTMGDGADCVIEAAGSPHTLQSAFAASRTGARVVLVGVIAQPVQLDLLTDFVLRELSLISAQQPVNPVVETPYYRFSQQRNREQLLRWIADGRMRVNDLISLRIGPGEAPDYYASLLRRKKADRTASDSTAGAGVLGTIIRWE